MPRDDERSSVPLTPIPGTPPDLFHPPAGCAFAPRCAAAMQVCAVSQPPELSFGTSRTSCWLHHPQAERQRVDYGIATLASSPAPTEAGL